MIDSDTLSALHFLDITTNDGRPTAEAHAHGVSDKTLKATLARRAG